MKFFFVGTTAQSSPDLATRALRWVRCFLRSSAPSAWSRPALTAEDRMQGMISYDLTGLMLRQFSRQDPGVFRPTRWGRCCVCRCCHIFRRGPRMGTGYNKPILWTDFSRVPQSYRSRIGARGRVVQECAGMELRRAQGATRSDFEQNAGADV
jgi:hypothetical protein